MLLGKYRRTKDEGRSAKALSAAHSHTHTRLAMMAALNTVAVVVLLLRSLNSFAAAAPCCSNSFPRVFRTLTAAILLAFVFVASAAAAIVVAFAGFTLSFSWLLLPFLPLKCFSFAS